MDLKKKLKELKPQQLNCNVFDVYSYNGLTMQDLLCQFFTTINECVKSTNEVIDLTDWLVNIGLEEEVVKKLMGVIKDGTVEKLINVNLFENLNKQLENKANETDLDVQRKRIDLLTKIENGETDGNAELLDIRIGYDGFEYGLAGNSIRKQIIKSQNKYSFNLMDLEFKANRFWNANNGDLQTNSSWTWLYSAEKINVCEGEKFILENFIGSGGLHPYVLANEEDGLINVISAYPSKSDIPGSVKYPKIEITIPNNVNRLLLSCANYTPDAKVYKEAGTPIVDILDDITDSIECLKNNNNDEIIFENKCLENRISKIENINKFMLKNFDKTYFAFIFDDSNSMLGDFYDLFHKYKLPISSACIHTKLDDTYKSRTIRDINNLIVADGGEILAHYSGSPNDSTTDEEWLKYTRDVKITLEKNGWDVRGLIRADNTQPNSQKGEKFCRKYFDYADTMCISSQYNLGGRRFVINNSLESFKNWINTCKNTPGFYPICIHGLRDDEPIATVENLELIINYIKSFENCEFTTYSKIFDRFGTTVLNEYINSLS